MENASSKKGTCSCEICRLHPHVKRALRRMQPPELKLYSRAELIELLERDIAEAPQAGQSTQVGSEECWWHLCAADAAFPLYVIPTKEFVSALASYLASRVLAISRDSSRTSSKCCSCSAGAAWKTSSCCSRWNFDRPVTILECGAGTGLLAAHVEPLVQKKLQSIRHRSVCISCYPQQQQQQDAEHTGREQAALPGHLPGSRVNAGAENSSSGKFAVPGDTITARSPPSQTQHTAGSTSAAESPVGASCEPSLFTYIASEPRADLQWCPRELGATRAGCRSVMQQHCPQLVICCWMPFNVDWTEIARSSCCACCRRAQAQCCGGDMSQRQSFNCQVREYVLIGHAEGGLVGRPLETWGLQGHRVCSLPLGIDYEEVEKSQDWQERGSGSSPYGAGTGCSVSAAEALKVAENQRMDRSKRRKQSTNGDATAEARNWQSVNNFCSLPPDVPASRDSGQTHYGLGKRTDGAAKLAGEKVVEFGGFELLPLLDRPYYREGFIRLPSLPLPADIKKIVGGEEANQDRLLQELQQAQPLSRFDSPHSLRAGCPPASRIVVFRRMQRNIKGGLDNR
ncbi:hypothetical protein, conserved [Eimeria tenella]|uniref:Uncharacterized protein n=1 Tax=Eimeria tenella TaxID=5802 RepID=U6KXM6_EIMTE|nr:hypothetical protein, conserved [Eimeria tenella]CDJ41074.1 hypothetical protein, conserved [Eimeria tenella]|eukprot:XP_013231824.1 hypothetical protein, conserved [Eimeria tenella]